MGITYKEYVWLIKPDDVNPEFSSGVLECPYYYGISDENVYDCPSSKFCDDCMNQEINYPVIAEVIRDTYLNPFEKITVGAKYKVTDVDMGAPAFGVEICVAGYKHWANNNNFRYHIDKGGKKLNKEFTKSDMKDGMLCETADGSRMFWIEGNLRGISEYNPCIKDDLTHLRYPMGDIVKVGYPDFGRYQTIEKAINGDFKEVIWERKENKEISSDEAFRVLKEHYGCDVKIKE